VSVSKNAMVSTSLFANRDEFSTSFFGLYRFAGWLPNKSLVILEQNLRHVVDLPELIRAPERLTAVHLLDETPEAPGVDRPGRTLGDARPVSSPVLLRLVLVRNHDNRCGISSRRPSCLCRRSEGRTGDPACPSFQSRRSVTNTAAMQTPPCTSLQSLARNDTAVATCRDSEGEVLVALVRPARYRAADVPPEAARLPSPRIW